MIGNLVHVFFGALVAEDAIEEALDGAGDDVFFLLWLDLVLFFWPEPMSRWILGPSSL